MRDKRARVAHMQTEDIVIVFDKTTCECDEAHSNDYMRMNVDEVIKHGAPSCYICGQPYWFLSTAEVPVEESNG